MRWAAEGKGPLVATLGPPAHTRDGGSGPKQQGQQMAAEPQSQPSDPHSRAERHGLTVGCGGGESSHVVARAC